MKYLLLLLIIILTPFAHADFIINQPNGQSSNIQSANGMLIFEEKSPEAYDPSCAYLNITKNTFKKSQQMQPTNANPLYIRTVSDTPGFEKREHNYKVKEVPIHRKYTHFQHHTQFNCRDIVMDPYNKVPAKYKLHYQQFQDNFLCTR